ncbi:MAG TPA: RodZ domain-containing protein [Stellaceae bacterium]
MLRQRREALGLELGEIAAALKIKPAYLSALEQGRPDQLPGPAYAAGFVRAYGAHLGLDAGEILRQFRVESAALDPKSDLSFPMPLGERSIPGGSMLLAALILALCGYGTWFYLSSAERSRPERVTEVPVDLLAPKAMHLATTPNSAAMPKAAAIADQPPPAKADTVPTTVLPAVETPAAASTAGSAATSSTPAASEGAEKVAVPTAEPDAAATRGGSDSQNRIELRATADSWIAVRNAERAILFTRLLKAGETYDVPDQSGLSLRTGNAGGLEITVGGKPVPAIGPNGAVRGNVALDPQALLAGTAVRD